MVPIVFCSNHDRNSLWCDTYIHTYMVAGIGLSHCHWIKPLVNEICICTSNNIPKSDTMQTVFLSCYSCSSYHDATAVQQMFHVHTYVRTIAGIRHGSGCHWQNSGHARVGSGEPWSCPQQERKGIYTRNEACCCCVILLQNILYNSYMITTQHFYSIILLLVDCPIVSSYATQKLFNYIPTKHTHKF